MSAAAVGGPVGIDGLADAAGLVAGALRAAIEPRDELGLEAWSERFRVISDRVVGAAKPGPFRFERTPYWRQVARDIDDARVREVWVQKSAQLGWTDLIFNAALKWAHHDLRQSMIVYPTHSAGVRMNETRLVPAIEDSPALARLIRSRRNDIRTNQIALGPAVVIFANAQVQATLKSLAVPFGVADEVDEFEDLEAVLGNLRDRAKTFARSKLIGGSTPVDHAGVERCYDDCADRHRLLVPCPITGGFFELRELSLLRWRGGANGDPDEAARTAHVRSPLVPRDAGPRAGRIEESHKAAMVRNGVWVRQGETIESDGAVLAAFEGGSPGWRDLSAIDADAFREAPRSASGRRYLSGRLQADESRARELRARAGVRIVAAGGGEDDAGERRPPASTRAYRLNEFVSLLSVGGWGGIAAEFVRQRGRPTRAFYNGVLGRSAPTGADAPEAHELERLCATGDTAHHYGDRPADGLLLLGTVDVQKDCVYFHVYAVGPAGTDPALCWARRIPRQEAHRLLDIELEISGREAMDDGHGGQSPGGFGYRNADGEIVERVGLAAVGIDCGYLPTQVHDLVERMNAKHEAGRGPRAYALRGSDTVSIPVTTRVQEGDRDACSGKFVRYDRPRTETLFRADAMKNDAFARILHARRRAEGKPGAFDHPGGGVILPERESWDRWAVQSNGEHDPRRTMRQMSAEHRRLVRRRGREVYAWTKKEGERDNHEWDTYVQLAVVAELVGGFAMTAHDIEGIRSAMRSAAAMASAAAVRPAPAPAAGGDPAPFGGDSMLADAGESMIGGG